MSDGNPQPSQSAAGSGTESTEGPLAEGPPVEESVEESADQAGSTEPVDATEHMPTEVEALTAERDEWMDRAQRIAADFENYRRRLATQKADDIDRATG